MKKAFKIILFIVIGIIFLDTFQAKIFNNSPFLKVVENYKEGNLLRKDKGILVDTYVFKDGEKVTAYKWEKNFLSVSVEPQKDEDFEKKGEEEQMKNIKVIIKNQKYNVTLEGNETVNEFLEMLPQEFTMKELNGNEKYVYMDNSLPTNSINQKHIKSGDIMLYGNDCLVIFYKSFDTNYSYTKIGHIDNLPDLENDSVIVKFEQ